MYGIGYFFHFQPSEINELEINEFLFWADGLNKVAEWRVNSLT